MTNDRNFSLICKADFPTAKSTSPRRKVARLACGQGPAKWDSLSCHQGLADRSTSMIKIRRLGHATLTTPDIERQIAYYTEIVGLTLVERGKDRAFLPASLGSRRSRSSPVRAMHCRALSLPGRARNRSGRRRARARQATASKAERASGISPGIAEAVVFTDPKGTLVEIFSDYAFAKDDGRQAGIMPLKLGHVAYRVDDVQKIVKFYCDVLGFRVSDWHADDFRLSPLQFRPSHGQFRLRRRAAAPSHRLRGQGLGGNPACRRDTGEARYPSGLGPGPPHHRPQYRDLSSQRRQGAGRVLLRDGSDEGRDARLFRSAAMAPGPAATAESVGPGHAAQLLGLWLGARSSAAIRRSNERRQLTSLEAQTRCRDACRVASWRQM